LLAVEAAEVPVAQQVSEGFAVHSRSLLLPQLVAARCWSGLQSLARPTGLNARACGR
jgi:hypothetical protein